MVYTGIAMKLNTKQFQIDAESPEYPANLKKIKYFPKILYFKGNLDVFQNEHFFSVVGTRRASPYGKRVLRSILPEIAKRKIVIVSGLAKGIDILAHQIALENDCPTIAVLAGGLDQIYPPEHKNVAEKIIKSGGLIVSEHPAGTDYLRQYFPARNRIISGLSQATLVVEAGQKSGALITADFARKQERKVFSVPGNIFSPESRGTNQLFTKGALLVESSDDILDFYFPRRKRRNKNIKIAHRNISAEISMSEEEKIIFESLSLDVPTPLNKIIQKSQMPPPKAISIVTRLEIRSLIENTGGANYIRQI